MTQHAFVRGDALWRVLATLFTSSILCANAMAAKLVDITFFGRPLAVCTVGALAIPVVYTTCDLLNELYGKHATRQVVWMGFIANGVLALYSLAFDAIDSAKVGAPPEAFHAVFGITWRVVLASQTAYLCSGMLDVEIFHRVRLITGERMLWLRQSIAVVFSQAVDTTVFMVIAFAFAPNVPLAVLPLLALTEYLVKISMTPARTMLSYYILKRIRSRS